jgi:hypothetical protein
MSGQVLLFVTGKNPVFGSLFVLAGIGLHFAYAYYLEWLRGIATAKPLRAA